MMQILGGRSILINNIFTKMGTVSCPTMILKVGGYII